MASFRELLADDLGAVFFNADEFATEHDIDGKTVSVVVDNDLLTARKVRAGKVQGEGLFEGDLLFFVPVGRIASPLIGQVMRFDRRPYRVADVAELDGMLTVTLKGARA